MTPLAIFSLVKDAVIVVIVLALLYMVYHAGQNQVKVSDLKGLESELKAQAATTAQWREESNSANNQLSLDVSAINTAAAVAKPPIWMCDKPNSKPSVLPSSSTPAGSPSPSTGGTVEGSGRDIRPQITAFESKYETALAECRAAIAQWPH
jgi:hypothetical protein